MDESGISLFILEHKTAAYDEHVVKQGRVKPCQILVLMVHEAHDIVIFVILIIMSQDIPESAEIPTEEEGWAGEAAADACCLLNSKATFYGEQGGLL